MTTPWIIAIALTVGIACAGCSASLPDPVAGRAVGGSAVAGVTADAQIDTTPPQTDSRQTRALVPPAAPAPGSSAGSTAGLAIGGLDVSRMRSEGIEAAVCTRCRIIAFKPQIVTLFMSETGQDGQRVPRTALPVPVVATPTHPTKLRLAIMTMDGQRWVSAADVVTEQLP